jgi:hypothetical protein
VQHAGSRPVRQRFLRNQFFGKMEIEFGNEHTTIIERAPPT